MLNFSYLFYTFFGGHRRVGNFSNMVRKLSWPRHLRTRRKINDIIPCLIIIFPVKWFTWLVYYFFYVDRIAWADRRIQSQCDSRVRAHANRWAGLTESRLVKCVEGVSSTATGTSRIVVRCEYYFSEKRLFQLSGEWAVRTHRRAACSLFICNGPQQCASLAPPLPPTVGPTLALVAYLSKAAYT